MRIMTQNETAEPYVEMTIPFDRLTVDITHEVEELLWLYSDCRRDGENLIFSVPAYRYREEIEPAIWRTAYEYLCAKMPITRLIVSKGVWEGRSQAEILAALPPHSNMSQELLSRIKGAINHLIVSLR